MRLSLPAVLTFFSFLPAPRIAFIIYSRSPCATHRELARRGWCETRRILDTNTTQRVNPTGDLNTAGTRRFRNRRVFFLRFTSKAPVLLS